MLRLLFIIVILLSVPSAFAQSAFPDSLHLSVSVTDNNHLPVHGATVTMVEADDSDIVQTVLSDEDGLASFANINKGNYIIKISQVGFEEKETDMIRFPSKQNNYTIVLEKAITSLDGVVITSTRPFIEHVQGKTLINVDASVTNIGTTVLDVLEKSPGVMVDRNGSISLQAKTGVLVLIDDKPTYLSGSDLNNLLSSMSSSQVEQIELMPNPPAKYDANGNAGVINIKTKHGKQRGFNGSLNISGGMGRYGKTNNSLVLNMRNEKLSAFLTFSSNWSKYYTSIDAKRKYYAGTSYSDNLLDQSTLFNGRTFNNTLKTGLDYYVTTKTTLGMSLTAVNISRKGGSDAIATWYNTQNEVDSAVATYSKSGNRFRNMVVNINMRHVIDRRQELTFDADFLKYKISNDQLFQSQLVASRTANNYSEASQGDIPSDINIFSAKADHSISFGEDARLESGWKSSFISTDNLAAYQSYDGVNWYPDLGKTNHFIYKENINALYTSFTREKEKLSFQAGLRYEATSYHADQLGNAIRKDSSFKRNYQGLFPTGYISYKLDSNNSIKFTAGRRIDRPAFQKLNPFVFIINKYTYQSGNPFFLPQYSWNFELSHQYKELFTTAVSYSRIQNYFSQLFLTDTAGILIYSEGNVGKATNLGISVTVELIPAKWWSLTGQVLYNHKLLSGYNGNDYTSKIDQVNFNLNNQFRIGKIYTAELSGYYTTRARNDLQELLYPTGQLSVGIGRPVLKKKATIKLSMRDIFHTQVMEGLTHFQSAEEYFILRRDSRVVNLAFTWRFGNPLKQIHRSSNGGAGDEMQRAGSDN